MTNASPSCDDARLPEELMVAIRDNALILVADDHPVNLDVLSTALALVRSVLAADLRPAALRG
jgi:hypothetical protein